MGDIITLALAVAADITFYFIRIWLDDQRKGR